MALPIYRVRDLPSVPLNLLMTKRMARLSMGHEIWMDFVVREINQVDDGAGLIWTPTIEPRVFRVVAPRKLATDHPNRGYITCEWNGLTVEFDDSDRGSRLVSITGPKRIFGAPLSFGWQRVVRQTFSPTLQQEKTAQDNGDVTTLSLTLDSTPSENNLGLCAASRREGASGATLSVTGTDTWTNRFTIAGGDQNHYTIISDILFGAAASTGVTITNAGTDTSEECAMWVGEYSGMKTTGFEDADATNGASTAATQVVSHTAGVIASADRDQTDQLAVSASGIGGTSDAGTFSFDNGFAIQAEVSGSISGGDVNLLVGTKTLTAGGDVSTTVSWTDNDQASSVIAMYNTAVAPAAGGAAQYITLSGEI